MPAGRRHRRSRRCASTAGFPTAHPGRWRAGARGGVRATSAAAGVSASRRRSTRRDSTRSTTAAPKHPTACDATARRPTPGRGTTIRWCRRAFVHSTPDGRREVSLLLEGIHCGACIWLIEHWLAQRPGISRRRGQFRDATRARGLRPRRREALRRAARDRRHRLSRVAVRSRRGARRSSRREARTLLLRTAIALLAMMQVMMFALPDLRHDRGRRAGAPAAARLGEPHAHAACASLFRGAVLPRRVARPSPAAASAWTCRSRSASRPRSRRAPCRPHRARGASTTTR